jgi:hypothetical protein
MAQFSLAFVTTINANFMFSTFCTKCATF